MKRNTFVGKLVEYERRNNSIYGNPKYYGIFENEKGEKLEGVTATNASCGYAFLNNIDQIMKIEYHTTRTGNNIIDYITIK